MESDSEQIKDLDGWIEVAGPRRIVRFERALPVDAPTLWSSLTEPALVQGWLGPVEAFDLVVGGQVVALLHPKNGAWLRGVITDLEPGALVAFTWTVPAHGTTPEFAGSSVRLEVRQGAVGATLGFSHILPDEKRMFDILAASHLRLDQFPIKPGQMAHVDRERFVSLRVRYEQLNPLRKA